MVNKPTPDFDSVTDKTLELADLILAFGRIERVTKHADGERFETDTDHTVMLGIIACAYAKEFAPHLDLGTIAQFALVHDLVEVYAGDTMSFRIASTTDESEKESREKAALERIKKEYDHVFPWIGQTIEKYEQLDTPEACFVKFLDKILPKLTHILNDGAIVHMLKHTKETTEAFHRDQRSRIMEKYGKEHPEVEALYLAVTKRLVSKLFD